MTTISSANYARIVAELQRLSALVSEMAPSDDYPITVDGEVGLTLLERARTEYRRRRTRETLFLPGIFADPAWDILLDLFIRHLEMRSTFISDAQVAAHVPGTTGLRWIAKLVEDGLLMRRADPHDGRRHFVALTDHALTCMTRYFE